jgi:hypothetical protein
MQPLATFLQHYRLSCHPLYNVWSGMRRRCYNRKHEGYHRYGGRGIKICEEWRMNPTAFVNWGIENGYRKGLTIDRIDNDGNYQPNNCRFVTIKVNSNNRALPGPRKNKLKQLPKCIEKVDKHTFMVFGMVGGKLRYVSSTKTLEAAIQLRDTQEALRHYFPSLNVRKLTSLK